MPQWPFYSIKYVYLIQFCFHTLFYLGNTLDNDGTWLIKRWIHRVKQQHFFQHIIETIIFHKYYCCKRLHFLNVHLVTSIIWVNLFCLTIPKWEEMNLNQLNLLYPCGTLKLICISIILMKYYRIQRNRLLTASYDYSRV